MLGNSVTENDVIQSLSVFVCVVYTYCMSMCVGMCRLFVLCGHLYSIVYVCVCVDVAAVIQVQVDV